MVKLMGCFFGKPSTVDYSSETTKEKRSSKGLSQVAVNRVSSLKRNESLRSKGGDKRVGLLDRKLNGSKKVRDVTNLEIKEDDIDQVVYDPPVKGVGRRSVEWELIAAGWPSWLASVASEAINGWVPRRADTFEKIEKKPLSEQHILLGAGSQRWRFGTGEYRVLIGQGTYSSVYKARDLTNNKIVALKRVRFDNMDPESVKFMAREILILRKLDHPNVIKLEGLITGSSSLYLVFEYMEHDLTGLASLPDSKFSEPQVKCYMKQLLSGLDHCHSRGVLHRDIKGSNLLIDNNGILKIADFGLATLFDQKQSQPLTSRVVTLWYRPPELLLGATYYGVSIDLWSAGCILGELYARKPIMPGRTEVEQLHKIFKLCGSPSEEYWEKSMLPHSTGFKPLQPYRRRLAETFKDFPSVSIGLIDTLLAIDPAHRGTAASALKNEFFMTNPLPCDPSCLPKYAPSKEIDVKLREEESRRQRTGGGRSQRADLESEGRESCQALPEPNANVELVAAMKRRQDNLDSKSRNHYFSPNPHKAVSGLPIDGHRSSHRSKESNQDLTGHDPQRISHSGPLVPGAGWVRSEKRRDDILVAPVKANLSTSSRLVASRVSENPPKSDRLFFGHSNAGRGRARSKEPVLGNGIKKNKSHFSGPLLVPNHNADQMLKEHDRHIQEAARRARIDRARLFNNR